MNYIPENKKQSRQQKANQKNGEQARSSII